MKIYLILEIMKQRLLRLSEASNPTFKASNSVKTIKQKNLLKKK